MHRSSMQEGLNNLTSSLKGLHQAAEAAHAEEQAAKRARLEGQQDVSSMPGGKALAAFCLARCAATLECGHLGWRVNGSLQRSFA